MLLATAAGAALAQGATAVFDIPAGPLDRGLLAFGRQAGVQVSWDPAVLAGRSAGAVSGPATPQAALARLLAGTGLTAGYRPDGSVVISAPAAQTAAEDGAIVLDPVTIFGDPSATTLAGTRSSVAVVPAQPADSPAPATVRDAFRRMGNVSGPDSSETGFYIRGVNSEGFVPGAAGAPLATLYVDGVEQTVNAMRRGVRGMFDAEQVEVYRGPQSTLSGRNALLGAIYLRSKDPDFSTGAEAQLTYGSSNKRQAGIAVNGTFSPSLAWRLSAEWSQKDSDLNYPSYERFAGYKTFATDEYYTIRAKLLWQPAEDASTRVLVSYSHSYDNPNYNGIAGPLWSSASPGYGARRGDRWGALTPDMYLAMGIPELPAFQEMRTTKVDNFGIEVTHDISDTLRFTALTGWSRSFTDRRSINVGTPGEFLQTEGAFTQRTLSQEFRLNHEGERLKWVAGLYAAKADNDAWRDSMLLSFDQSRNTADITNLALFGQAQWQFTPGWSVIAGGRLDHIRQKQTAVGFSNFAPTVNTATAFRDTVFLPKLGFLWEPSDTQSVSLTWQEGYRPGGAGMVGSTVYTYKPESARVVELAWRGSFMDGRLKVSANLFRQDWRDQQIEVLVDAANPGLGTSIANAGRSRSHGGELDAAWAARDDLNLFASAAVLKSKFTDFNVAGYGNYTGLAFPGAPERSLALGFRWQQPGQGWFAAASARHVSSFLSRLEQGVPVPVKLPGYTTVDAEFGYAWEKVKLTAYATNLFDKQYLLDESGPGVAATLGDRREVGLRLDYRF